MRSKSPGNSKSAEDYLDKRDKATDILDDAICQNRKSQQRRNPVQVLGMPVSRHENHLQRRIQANLPHRNGSKYHAAIFMGNRAFPVGLSAILDGVFWNISSRNRTEFWGDATVRRRGRAGIDQIINRGVKPGAILDTMKKPMEVIVDTVRQTTKYVGDEAAVVISDLNDKIVTAWRKSKKCK